VLACDNIGKVGLDDGWWSFTLMKMNGVTVKLISKFYQTREFLNMSSHHLHPYMINRPCIFTYSNTYYGFAWLLTFLYFILSLSELGFYYLVSRIVLSIYHNRVEARTCETIDAKKSECRGRYPTPKRDLWIITARLDTASINSRRNNYRNLCPAVMYNMAAVAKCRRVTD